MKLFCNIWKLKTIPRLLSIIDFIKKEIKVN